MTPERWKKLDAMFHEAAELQGEARASFLAKVCPDNEQLRGEVELLLAARGDIAMSDTREGIKIVHKDARRGAKILIPL